jgi:hypothetical protein
MNTTRLLKLVIASVLILSALVAFKQYSVDSKGDVPLYTGRGDYQRYEMQSLSALTGIPPFTGMGDWRRFENQQALQNTHTGIGIGDLHRFEGAQAGHKR